MCNGSIFYASMSLSIISHIVQSQSLKGQWRTRFKVAEFYGPCFAQKASSTGRVHFPAETNWNHNMKKAIIPRITGETIATNNTITGQTKYTHIGYKSK